MTSDPRHKDYGYSIEHAISMIPGELSIDAVGLWQIVPIGRDGFGLSGQALTDFVRRGISALLDAGAVPVRHQSGSGYDWTPEKQYGQSAAQITDAVVREWLAMPDDPLALCGEGVWFAKPDPTSRHVQPT